MASSDDTHTHYTCWVGRAQRHPRKQHFFYQAATQFCQNFLIFSLRNMLIKYGFCRWDHVVSSSCLSCPSLYKAIQMIIGVACELGEVRKRFSRWSSRWVYTTGKSPVMTQVSGAERKSNNNGTLITFYARFFICSILAYLYSLMSSELIYLWDRIFIVSIKF